MQLTSAVALSLLSLGVIAAPKGTYPGQPTSYPGSGSGGYPGSGSGGYPGSGSGGYPGSGSGGYPGSGSGGYPGSGSGGYPGSGSGGYPGSGSGGYPGAPGSTSKTTAAPGPQPTSAKASSAAPAPATTSAPSANPPAGGAPIFESFTFSTAASSNGANLIGGVLGATGGPAGGAIGGTGVYVTGEPEATGFAGGAFAGGSGALRGGANPTELAGCAGGEDSGFGETQCFTAPLMPRATEAPRPSGAPGFFETFTYSTAVSSNGANLIGGALGATQGAAGGAIGGTGVYQTGQPAATGFIGGADSGASGKLRGGANPTELAGCAGGEDSGFGYTQCYTAPLMARATAMPM